MSSGRQNVVADMFETFVRRFWGCPLRRNRYEASVTMHHTCKAVNGNDNGGGFMSVPYVVMELQAFEI